MVLKGFGKTYLSGFDGSPYTAPDLCGVPSGDRGLGARASGMSANAQKVTANHPNQDLENLLCRIQENFRSIQLSIVDLGQRDFDDALDGLELIDLKGGKIQRIDGA